MTPWLTNETLNISCSLERIRRLTPPALRAEMRVERLKVALAEGETPAAESHLYVGRLCSDTTIGLVLNLYSGKGIHTLNSFSTVWKNAAA
jgi:hypothetical protein